MPHCRIHIYIVSLEKTRRAAPRRRVGATSSPLHGHTRSSSKPYSSLIRTVIFIVSDLHLGKSPGTDPERLDALRACIRAENVSDVIFLGDVFDAFIESSAAPPPVVAQWGDLVRTLRREGIRVRYLMGNHDRWHRRFVADSTGQPPIRHAMRIDAEGASIHLEHGDRAQPHPILTRAGRWLSDQAWMHRAYTMALPFGGAQALAARISRRFASFEPNPFIVNSLQEHALKTLRQGSVEGAGGVSSAGGAGSVEGIIMGHCHRAELTDLTNEAGQTGWYANSGDWYADRTYVLLGMGRVQVCRWQEGGPETLAWLPTGADSK